MVVVTVCFEAAGVEASREDGSAAAVPKRAEKAALFLMNFQFSNLIGSPYRGGNLVIHGNDLLSPVGNRVGQIDLVNSSSRTLPFENQKQVRTLCVSSHLLLSIDEDGRALLLNRARRVCLHRFSFKGPVSVAKFSPDGSFVAVGVGRLVQVWRTPSMEKQMTPMQLHRTYGQCHADVLDLDWSPDGQFLAVASKDIVARVFSLNPIPGFEPPVLAGHRDGIVGVYFSGEGMVRASEMEGGSGPAPLLHTISRDGAVFSWTFTPSTEPPSTKVAAKRKRSRATDGEECDDDNEVEAVEEGASLPWFPFLGRGTWSLGSKHYTCQTGKEGGAGLPSKVSSTALHVASGVLAIGYTTGVFEMMRLPTCEGIQVLSVSRERVSSLAFNESGTWLAVGCAKLGQLLVWEWKSETYVLKQQGHYFDVACCSFSPDGSLVATGSDDRKVKVFNQNSGFCFVTFSEHTAPVTAVQFMPSGHALVTASLDGTVRAFDLVRYRNFRTLTAPSPVQFGCLAVDPGGEIIAAGTLDSFQIYVWSIKTGRLLDVLSGHEGPVSCLSFSPGEGGMLASGSWDKTVRTWDVYKGPLDTLTHSHDVLALAFRPDGKQLAASTLDGNISFWDPQEAESQGFIEGRRDIKGGRLASDRRVAGNLDSGSCFSSLAYGADGSFLLAGGLSKYVCVYDTKEKVMLRRFQTTKNKSVDGVLDTLNSKNMTDAGPLQLIDHEEEDIDVELLPPNHDPSSNKRDITSTLPGSSALNAKKPVARTRCIALSPTNRCWAAAGTEGLLLYSLDDDLFFDPNDLTEELTPEACHKSLVSGSHSRALLIALRLGDASLTRHCIMSTPAAKVRDVAKAIPGSSAPLVLSNIADLLSTSPHFEFLLNWSKAVCVAHGPRLSLAGASSGGLGGQLSSSSQVMPALRSLQKTLNRAHEDLSVSCEGNVYLLSYLLASGATREKETQSRAATAAAAAAVGEKREKEGHEDGGLGKVSSSLQKNKKSKMAR